MSRSNGGHDARKRYLLISLALVAIVVGAISLFTP